MAKHKKLPKDPNAPKKPTRPYIYFLMDVRKKVSQEMTKEHDEVGTHHHEVSRECARRWALLPAEKKEKYHEKFREDQNRYREALKSYTPSPDFQEAVRLAKLNSTGSKAYVSTPRHDPNVVKVPHMIKAYFDYMANTWASVAASHPSYNPGQVQNEIWRRWSQGDNGGGLGSSVFDENQNIEKKQLKKRTRKRTAAKNPLPRPPRQAFDCYLETLTDEVRKLRPDLSDGEMHKLVSAKWKEMTDVQKLPFFEVERKEKQRYEVQMKKAQSKGEATSKENESKGDPVPVRLSGNVQKKVVIRPDVADIDEKVAVTQEQHNVSGIKEEKKEPDASVMSFDIDSKIPFKEEEKADVSANEYANKKTGAHKNLVDYSSDSPYEEEVEADKATILSTCSGSSDDSSDDDSDMFIISTPVDQSGMAGKPLPQ